VTSLLRRPDFRRLFIGQAVSGFGDWMVTIALMALVLKLSGSSTAVGGILLMRLLPAAVAGPIASRIGRAWGRRRTMLAADAVRIGIVVAIPLVSALWWAYVWAFALEVAGIVFLPARDSIIPDLVPNDELATANSLVLGSSYGTIPFGAAAFAAVAALSPSGDGFISGHPFVLVFFVDAATFAVSFALLSRLPADEPRVAASASPRDQERFIDALEVPLVRSVMAPVTAIALALGALFSLGVVYVRESLGASDAQFGILIAFFGIGAAFGLGGVHASRAADPVGRIRVGVLCQGVTVAVMSLANNLVLAFLGAALFGAATAFALAVGMTMLQAELDGHDRTLAFTAFHVVIRAGLGVSALGAGTAADLLRPIDVPAAGTLGPVRLVLFCSGSLVVASAVAARIAPRRAPAGPAASLHEEMPADEAP
jgi:MFS family permease